jgi:hypothetical protein
MGELLQTGEASLLLCHLGQSGCLRNRRALVEGTSYKDDSGRITDSKGIEIPNPNKKSCDKFVVRAHIAGSDASSVSHIQLNTTPCPHSLE